MLATGATADRPNTVPATALTGAFNNLNPAPALSLPFYDTTLSKTVYFVGTQRSRIHLRLAGIRGLLPLRVCR
jgi:hypothetical protein